MKIIKIIIILLFFCVLVSLLLYFSRWLGFTKASVVYPTYHEFKNSKNFIYVENMVPKDAFNILVFSGVDPSFYSLEFNYQEPLQWENKPSWKLIKNSKPVLDKYFKPRFWRNEKFDTVKLYKFIQRQGVVQFVLIDEINKYVWFSDGDFL